MKNLTVTPAQVQNFIYLLEDAPVLLSDFYLRNSENVYKKKKNWSIPMNYTATKWLKAELKSYIQHLQEEISDVEKSKTTDEYWIEEAKEHKNRIKLAQRVIEKLN